MAFIKKAGGWFRAGDPEIDPFFLGKGLDDLEDRVATAIGSYAVTNDFTILTESQSSGRQIRIGAQLIPSSGTTPDVKSWTLTGSGNNGAFITELLKPADPTVAPQPRSTPARIATGTTSVAPIQQSDTTPGDFQLAVVLSTPETGVSIGSPVGWTLHWQQNFGGQFYLNVWRRYANGSQPGTWTASGASSLTAVVVSFRDVQIVGSYPVDQIGSNSGQTGATQSNTVPGASTVNNDLYVVIGGWTIGGVLADPPGSISLPDTPSSGGIGVVSYGIGDAELGYSLPFRFAAATTLTKWIVMCDTAPFGGPLTIDFYKNTTTIIATVSILAGATADAVVTSTVNFSAGDKLTARVSSAGFTTPATGVVAQAAP